MGNLNLLPLPPPPPPQHCQRYCLFHLVLYIWFIAITCITDIVFVYHFIMFKSAVNIFYVLTHIISLLKSLEQIGQVNILISRLFLIRRISISFVLVLKCCFRSYHICRFLTNDEQQGGNEIFIYTT